MGSFVNIAEAERSIQGYDKERRKTSGTRYKFKLFNCKQQKNPVGGSWFDFAQHPQLVEGPNPPEWVDTVISPKIEERAIVYRFFMNPSH